MNTPIPEMPPRGAMPHHNQEMATFEPPQLPDRILHTNKSGTLVVSCRSFEHLRNKYGHLNVTDIFNHHAQDPDIADIHALFQLSSSVWKDAESRGLASLADSLEDHWQVVTTPGAKVYLLRAVNSPESGELAPTDSLLRSGEPIDRIGGQLVGGAVVHTKRENHLARPSFPIDHHGARLYVNDDARELGPRGGALDYLMSTILGDLKGGVIGTRILIEPKELAHFANRVTYGGYGFESTGEVVDGFATFEGKRIPGKFEWLVYPPRSDSGREALWRYKESQANKDRQTLKRLSQLVLAMPVETGVVTLVTPHITDGYDLANMYPRDVIFTVHSGSSPAQSKPEPRINLYHYQQERGLLALPDRPIDTVILHDALTDVLARGEAPEDFIKRIIEKLNTKGEYPPHLVIIERESLNFRKEDIESLMINAGFRVTSSRVENNGRNENTVTTVGEYVNPNAGTKITFVGSHKVDSPQFVSLRAFQDTETGRISILGSRPHPTIDFALFSGSSGNEKIHVQYGPRPHVVNPDGGKRIGNFGATGYLFEQMAMTGYEGGNIEEEARSALKSGYGVEDVKIVGEPMFSLPLARDLDEVVIAVPFQLDDRSEKISISKSSGLDSRRTVQAVDCLRFIQSVQAGAVSDDRLFRMIAARFLETGSSFGPCLFPLEPKNQVISNFNSVEIKEALRPEPEEGRERFVEIPLPEKRYFDVKVGRYAEVQRDGSVLKVQDLEYLQPSEEAMIRSGDPQITTKLRASNNSVLCVPYLRINGEIYVGLGKFESEAVQLHSELLYGYKSSQYSAFPLLSLPVTARTDEAAISFACAKLEHDYAINSLNANMSGGGFMATPGLSLNMISIIGIEVTAESAQKSPLMWVRLSEAIDTFRKPELHHLRKFLICGPTQSGLVRIAHACGELE